MFFSLHQVTDIQDVKVGMDLFKVAGLGKSSYLEKVTVAGDPYTWVPKTGWFSPAIFIPITRYSNTIKKEFTSEFSAMDAGIIPNGYNAHKTFFTREAAEAYMDNCKVLGRNIPHNFIHGN